MSQSLSKILLHVVFSTKNRKPWISESLQPQLHAYLAGACRTMGSDAIRVGGTDNHVHIACTLSRTLTVSRLLETIKKSSSQWIKKQDEANREFAWQAGYGAFSLGQSQLSALVRYIDNQREHHRVRSFDDELRNLLRKMSRPFRAHLSSISLPRALPWAGMSCPFRAGYRNPVPGKSQTQWGSE